MGPYLRTAGLGGLPLVRSRWGLVEFGPAGWPISSKSHAGALPAAEGNPRLWAENRVRPRNSFAGTRLAVWIGPLKGGAQLVLNKHRRRIGGPAWGVVALTTVAPPARGIGLPGASKGNPSSQGSREPTVQPRGSQDFLPTRGRDAL